MHNEKALLQQVAGGDEFAFRQLYMLWQSQLSDFIFRITRSRELSAEIIQDVFLKIWMSRETLSEIDNFKSYLFVISRNQALNALRKVMRNLKEIQNWEKINKEQTKAEAEDSKLIKLSIVDEAIDKLSPRQKEIYLLHRHEGLTYKQIADKLGIGKESVKTHLELAVRSITKYLLARLAILPS